VVNEPASWGDVLAAILPLAGYALTVLMAETMRRLLYAIHWGGLFRVLWADVIRQAPMPMLFYVLLLGGLLFAWVKAFPRWSYPYLGWLVILISCWLGVDDSYQWLMWGLWLFTMLLAVLLVRSTAPLIALWRNVRRDWTLASFALFGILLFMVLATFDEMPGPRASRTLWESLSAAVLVLGALWYMRASGRAGRIAALLSGAALSVVLSTGSIAYYWHHYPKPHIQPPLNGYRMLASGLVFLAVVMAFLLAPALLAAGLKRLWTGRSSG